MYSYRGWIYVRLIDNAHREHNNFSEECTILDNYLKFLKNKKLLRRMNLLLSELNCRCSDNIY